MYPARGHKIEYLLYFIFHDYFNAGRAVANEKCELHLTSVICADIPRKKLVPYPYGQLPRLKYVGDITT